MQQSKAGQSPGSSGETSAILGTEKAYDLREDHSPESKLEKGLPDLRINAA